MSNLVDRIANGDAILLGVDDICKRLGVSRTTFDRWVRNGGAKSVTGPGYGVGMRPLSDLVAGDNLTFPAPDIRIGNSPKWEMDTFKTWLRANMTDPKG